MPVELSAAGGEGQPRPLLLGPGRTTTVEGGGKIKIHDSRELAYDLDGDGMLDEKEVLRLMDQKAQGDRTIAHMTKGLAILGALLVVFFGISIGSVVHSVNVASEGQAKVSGTNELIAADGVAIAVTAVAVEDAPLYIIPVLPDDVIKRMGSITVSVDMSTDLDNSSGTDAVTAFSTGLPQDFNIDHAEYTFNIATFAKVNSTCAILSSAAGDVLLLNAGRATLTFGAASAFSGTVGVCSAAASCSRTSVNGMDIEGYMRAADAALVSAGIRAPFHYDPVKYPFPDQVDNGRDSGRQRRSHMNRVYYWFNIDPDEHRRAYGLWLTNELERCKTLVDERRPGHTYSRDIHDLQDECVTQLCYQRRRWSGCSDNRAYADPYGTVAAATATLNQLLGERCYDMTDDELDDYDDRTCYPDREWANSDHLHCDGKPGFVVDPEVLQDAIDEL